MVLPQLPKDGKDTTIPGRNCPGTKLKAETKDPRAYAANHTLEVKKGGWMSIRRRRGRPAAVSMIQCQPGIAEAFGEICSPRLHSRHTPSSSRRSSASSFISWDVAVVGRLTEKNIWCMGSTPCRPDCSSFRVRLTPVILSLRPTTPDRAAFLSTSSSRYIFGFFLSIHLLLRQTEPALRHAQIW